MDFIILIFVNKLNGIGLAKYKLAEYGRKEDIKFLMSKTITIPILLIFLLSLHFLRHHLHLLHKIFMDHAHLLAYFAKPADQLNV